MELFGTFSQQSRTSRESKITIDPKELSFSSYAEHHRAVDSRDSSGLIGAFNLNPQSIEWNTIETTPKDSEYGLSTFIKIPFNYQYEKKVLDSGMLHFRSLYYSFDYLIALVPGKESYSLKILFFSSQKDKPKITISLSSMRRGSFCFEEEQVYTSNMENAFLNETYFNINNQHFVQIRISIFNEGNKAKPGLLNSNSCCYANCLMQLLARTSVLNNAICNPEKGNAVLTGLKEIIEKVLTQKEEINLVSYYQKLNILSQGNNQQKDFSELFMKVVSFLIECNPKVGNVFESKVTVLINNIETNEITQQNEILYPLLLDIPLINEISEISLSECISKHFQSELIINEKGNKIIRTSKIESLPSILIIILKRFSNSQKKINTKVSYPSLLDLSSYVNGGESSYSLFSVLVQEGDLSNGHYLIDIYNIKKGKWYEYNDQSIKQIKSINALNDNFGGYMKSFTLLGDEIKETKEERSRSAYMLFYVKASMMNELIAMNEIEEKQETYYTDCNKPKSKRLFEEVLLKANKENSEFHTFTMKLIQNHFDKHCYNIKFDLTINLSKEIYSSTLFTMIKESQTELFKSLNLSQIKLVLLNSIGVFVNVLSYDDSKYNLQYFFKQWKSTGMRTIYIYSIESNKINVCLQKKKENDCYFLPFFTYTRFFNKNIIYYDRSLIVKNDIGNLINITHSSELITEDIDINAIGDNCFCYVILE